MDFEPIHPIEHEILRILAFRKTARYRDMRPQGVDSNLFNYHRRVLVREGFIEKAPNAEYQLAVRGLKFIESTALGSLKSGYQPKLSIAFLLSDSQGRIAVWNKQAQPFIGMVHMPNCKLQYDDVTARDGAFRILREITSEEGVAINLKGIAEVSVRQHGELLSHTMYVIAQAVISPMLVTNKAIYWIEADGCDQYPFVPGIYELCRDYYRGNMLECQSYIVEL